MSSKPDFYEQQRKDDRRLRDVVALSTLPAIWRDAKPERFAEILASALYTTLGAEIVFVGLLCDPQEAPVSVAQVGRYETDDRLAAELEPPLFELGASQDPEKPFDFVDPRSGRNLLVTVHPVGLDAEYGVIAAGFRKDFPSGDFSRLLVNIGATQAATTVRTMRLTRSLRESLKETEFSRAAEQRAREDAEILHDVVLTLAGELDLHTLLQRVTDAAVELTGAQIAAYFNTSDDGSGGSYSLYTLSGAPRKAFEGAGMPRNTALFAPTFTGQGIVRSDDIRKDPRYGRSAPHYGIPKGHLPVSSYLAAPVRSRSGEILGGLILGHAEPGVFTERGERQIEGLAAQAAIAIDNARLYGQAQQEIEARRRNEEHQKFLIDELNHRVKNTLATVLSLGTRTLSGQAPLEQERRDFLARIQALAGVHNLLTEEEWAGAPLVGLVREALLPFSGDDESLFVLDGPDVHLVPKTALTLGMAFHELATNALKYGALSKPGGQVHLSWRMADEGVRKILSLHWQETGGPPVAPPKHRGFGSLLIQRGLGHDLDGEAELVFAVTGLTCRIVIPLGAENSADEDTNRESG